MTEKISIEDRAEAVAHLNAFCQHVMSHALKTEIGPWGTLYAFGMMAKLIQHIAQTDKTPSEPVEVTEQELFAAIKRGFDRTAPQLIVLRP